MLIYAVVLATLLAPKPPTPVDRFAAFMKKADALTVNVRATVPGNKEVGVGRLEWRRPMSQRFTMKWGSEHFELRQSAKGIVAYMHERRLYQDYSSHAALTPPPDVPSMAATYGYPFVLLAGDLRSLLPSGEAFKPSGTTTIGGSAADVVSVSFSRAMAKIDYTAAIDQAGRLLRFTLRKASSQGTLEVSLDFSDYQVVVPKADAFTPKLPWGYVPLQVKPQPEVPDLGQKLTLGRWTSASGKKVDVAALAKGRPLVVLFTQEGCTSSQGAEKALRALRERLEAHQGRMIEVVLGASKPKAAYRDPKRALFIDPDGSIEREFGVPGSPYLVLFGADGLTTRAWFGYDPKQPMALVDGICSGLPANR